jgi:hypothetical protein
MDRWGLDELRKHERLAAKTVTPSDPRSARYAQIDRIYEMEKIVFSR